MEARDAHCATCKYNHAVQLLLGPIGWFWPDQVIDVLATIAMTLLIGFYPLLLPTFILELVPLVDM